MKDLDAVYTEMATHTFLRFKVDHDKYEGLRHLSNHGFMVSRVELSKDDTITVYLAIGETVRMNKILVPEDVDMDIVDDLIEATDYQDGALRKHG